MLEGDARFDDIFVFELCSDRNCKIATTALCNCTCKAAVPSRITNLFSTGNISADSISITWIPITNIEDAGGVPVLGYNAVVSSGNASSPIMSTLNISSNYVTFSGLLANTSFMFTVSAVNSVGQGAASSVWATTLPRILPPVIDMVNTTTLDLSIVGCSWFIVQFAPVPNSQGYRILVTDSADQQLQMANCSSSTDSSGVVQFNVRTPTYTLKPSQQYFIQIVTIGVYGESNATAKAAVVTAPTVPLLLGCVAVAHSLPALEISWAPSINGNIPIVGYKVSYVDAGSLTQVISTTSTSVRLASLKPGTKYSVAVQAINAAGVPSVFSMPVVQGTVPAAPVISWVASTTSSTSVKVQQAASGAEELPLVEYSVSLQNSIVRLTAASGHQIVTIGGLGANRCDLVASASVSNSANFSASVTVAVATAPTPPSSVHVSQIKANGFTVLWQPLALDGGCSLLRFEVEVSSASGVLGTFNTKDGSRFSLDIADSSRLQPNSGYNITVYAVNKAGKSPASQIVAARTAMSEEQNPGIPSRVSANTAWAIAGGVLGGIAGIIILLVIIAVVFLLCFRLIYTASAKGSKQLDANQSLPYDNSSNTLENPREKEEVLPVDTELIEVRVVADKVTPFMIEQQPLLAEKPLDVEPGEILPTPQSPVSETFDHTEPISVEQQEVVVTEPEPVDGSKQQDVVDPEPSPVVPQPQDVAFEVAAPVPPVQTVEKTHETREQKQARADRLGNCSFKSRNNSLLKFCNK